MQKEEPLQQQQEQVPLAEVSVQLRQVKFVQPNLAVAEGRVVLTDKDFIKATSSSKHKVSSILGFVHHEPCSVFFRSRDTVQRLQDCVRGIVPNPSDKEDSVPASGRGKRKAKGTGRWHSLTTTGETNQDNVVMRIQTVLTRAIERNRKGTKLIECQNLIDVGILGTLMGAIESKSTPPAKVTLIERVGQPSPTPPTDTTISPVASAPIFQMYDKSQRQELFADWLVNIYGKEFLCQGSGVLDVAGGKGDLSRALQKRGIPSVVLDPDPRFDSSHDGRKGIRIPVIAVALEGDGSHLFRDTKEEGNAETEEPTHATTTTARERHLIRTCSMIAAMHPDQATEPILKLARLFGTDDIKPFAILPCCVMPSLFPHRVYQGQPVRSYKIFCQYLQSLYDNMNPTCEGGNTNYLPKIQVDYLPFMGRNMILYTAPGQFHSVSRITIQNTR